MKGEIIRRMSLEIIKDDVVIAEPIRKEIDTVEEDDDYLVKTIGAFGLWQGVVCVAVSLTRMIAAWNMLSLPFLIPAVEFVCVEFSDNFTIAVKNLTCYDNCLKYTYSSAVGRSIVEDFGLICQNAWLAGFAQSVLMMGIVIGVLVFGWISDKFGRRKAMLISTIMNAILIIALPFSPSYIIFAIIKFLIGLASGGSMFVCVVQIMEIIGKRHIEVAGVLVLIPECIAQASLAIFSYFTPNWQAFTLSYGIATCLILGLMFFIPESPRWLMANGKLDEAVTVITKAANRNKLETSNIKAELIKALEDMKLRDGEAVKASYLDILKSKSLFLPTFAIFVIWFSLCMCFYGIYQYVTIIRFNPYVAVVLLGLIQIPFFPVGIIVNKKFGRKISTISTLMCIAVVTLILVFIPKDRWYGTMLGVIAFVSTNICFSISYVHVSELYPTPLRNMSYGLVSCGAMIGSIIAPFIANLLPTGLSSLVFSISAVIAGLCSLAVPETKGRNLKDAMDN